MEETNEQARWEKVKKTFPAGTVVSGQVVHVAKFGVFIAVPEIEFKCLADLLSICDDVPFEPQFPSIGSTVKAVVIGYSESSDREVRLSMKRSDFLRFASTDSKLVRHVLGVELYPDHRYERYGFDELNSYLANGAVVVAVVSRGPVLGDDLETDRHPVRGFEVDVLIREGQEGSTMFTSFGPEGGR